MAASNVAASLAALLSPARAEASRRNGAMSRGPATPEGKARASRNALKHGLRAEKHVVVEGESPQAFAAFEAALLADLAAAGRPAGPARRPQRARRLAARARRALGRRNGVGAPFPNPGGQEAELFARQMDGPFGEGDLGLALVRDGNGARAFDRLLRYRAAAQAEFSRALRLLKALQAEARAREAPLPGGAAGAREPIEPETCRNPGRTGPAPAAAGSEPALADRGADAASTRPEQDLRLTRSRGMPARTADPIEPEARAIPAEIVPEPAAEKRSITAARRD